MYRSQSFLYFFAFDCDRILTTSLLKLAIAFWESVSNVMIATLVESGVPSSAGLVIWNTAAVVGGCVCMLKTLHLLSTAYDTQPFAVMTPRPVKSAKTKIGRAIVSARITRTRLMTSNENKMSDGWRDSAWLPTE